MAKLSFKVYLVNEDPAFTEVRRFGVDADVAANFIYLREKLQTIFPDLQGKNFTVTWKDNENETITISTNEELEIALEEMAKNDIYKLYVCLQLPEREMIDLSKIEKIEHPGVVCDVCNKYIRGMRFKCIQCMDYDLCTDCMLLGNHSHHFMVRMAQPIDWSSYHGRRFGHYLEKFMKKSAHCYKENERRYLHRSKRNGCPFAADGKFYCPFDSESAIKFIEKFIIDISGAPPDENREQKRNKEQQHREPSAEAATEATEDPQQEATRHSFSQLLKIVEDNISNISQFLDPLGISVTVMADDSTKNKQTDNAQTKTNAQKPETRASTSSENSGKKFPGEGKKLRDDPVTAATSLTDNTSLQKEPATATATTATTTSTEQAAEAEEWTMIQRENPVTRASSASSSDENATKEVTPSAPMAESEKTSSKQIYPSLPEEIRHEAYHPNPKIQRAVEAMMAMGFSNEGSWLTHLLVAQNGNIDKALDVIHPVRHN